jgi:translation initiation factor IF-2
VAKIRVQQLAKELNVPVQEIMKKLEGLGIFVPNPMSTLEPAEVVKIKSLITGKKITMVRKKVVKTAPAEATEKKAEAKEKPAEAAEEKKAAPAKPAEVKAEAKAEAKAEPAKEEKKPEAVKAAEKPEKAPETKPAEAASAKPEKSASQQSEKAKEEKPAAEAAKARQETAGAQQRGGERRPRTEGGMQDRRQSRSGDGRRTGGARPADGRSSEGRGGENRRYGAQGGERSANGSYNRNAGGRSGDSRGSDNRSGEGRRYNNNNGSGRGSQSGDRSTGGYNRGGQDHRRSEGRRSSADFLDTGLAIPERPKLDEKPVKKNDRIRKEKQKNTATEEYKNKKNKLMQEANYLEDDRLARHKKKGPKKPVERQAVQEEEISIIALPDSMTVKEFADMLHKPINQIIKALMGKGIMAGLNQMIEFEQAEELAMDMGILVEHQVEEDIFAAYANHEEDSEEDMATRPPVVVVMGHVDHGKTSLLDAIRDTKVTEGEAGGITQHIGASVVEIEGRKITFLDTPGHEAFTAMRMRGAQVTDIAILVVAADDGVMPQTVEAINHAKAAGIQIIVAINKMDKPGANPDRVKQELTEHGLIAEDWGGTTICVPVSAKKREGIDNLLEMVLLVADMGELKANPNCLASGTVVESQLDRGRGAVATVLVQRGTLHVGDTIVAGSAFGRVKAMVDDKGRRVKEAGPSKPVEIIGLNEVPAAGETFYHTETEREARLLAEKVSARERTKLIEGNKKVNLNDLFGDIQAGNVKELNIVVKADVQGSVEAVKQSLEKLSNEEVSVKVIHGAVGAVNESDVMLASASNSIIIGFNVRPDASAKSVAEEQKVDVRLYRVIYNAIEDIEAAMKGMLDPEFQEKVIGHAEVRQVFKASGVGTIAGSYVTDGKINRNASARLVRDGIVIHEGALGSLRRFKDDVKEVNTGFECGIMFEKYSDIKEGDVIEAFIMEEIKRD